MKTPIILLLGATISLAPSAVLAQPDASPAATGFDPSLVAELCQTVAADDNETAACIADVERALAGMAGAREAEELTLLERAEALAEETGVAIDEALDEMLDLDISVAFDDVLTTLDEIDIGATIEATLDEANLAIEDADMQARVDEVLAALDDRVTDARTIAVAAQTWAQENPEAACLGSSLGLGATAGLVVVAVTGIEALGLQAFRTTEQFTNDLCSNVVGG